MLREILILDIKKQEECPLFFLCDLLNTNDFFVLRFE